MDGFPLKELSDDLEGMPLGWDSVIFFCPNHSMNQDTAKLVRNEISQRFEWRGPLVTITCARAGDFFVMPIDIAEEVYKLLHARFGKDEGEGWKKGINVT